MPRNLSDVLGEDRTSSMMTDLMSCKRSLTENSILALHSASTTSELGQLSLLQDEEKGWPTKSMAGESFPKRKRVEPQPRQQKSASRPSAALSTTIQTNSKTTARDAGGGPVAESKMSSLFGSLSEKYQKLCVMESESSFGISGSGATPSFLTSQNPYASLLESTSLLFQSSQSGTGGSSLPIASDLLASFPTESLFLRDVKKTEVDVDKGALDGSVSTIREIRPLDVKRRRLHLDDSERGGVPLFSSEDVPDFAMDMEEQDAGQRGPFFLEMSVSEKKDSLAQEKIQVKARFLHVVSGSLIASPNYKKVEDPRRIALLQSAESVAAMDPEFILKVALYTRCNLNVRVTANFLLAYAATLPKCRPYLKKYFNAAVRLPTDWIDVSEHYEVMSSKRSSKGRCPLPTALRKAMVEKFPEFDEYQLAKHNKQKKTNKKKQKQKKSAARKGLPPPSEQGRSGSSNTSQNLKKLVRQLHLTKPAHLVMAIIGKRYPSDAVEFSRSGLLGVWEEERAGKRMKLVQPETWETQVSAKGNKPQVWQDLLDHKKLPYMAMLRNLKNMIKAGISMDHHNGVLKRLQDENAVIHSKQFPFRFFSAYEVLETLRTEYKKKIAELSAESQGKPKLAVGTRGKTRILKTQKKWWLLKKKKPSSSINYDETLLNRYQKGLDSAVKTATIHNVKPIPGRSVVLCNVGSSMDIPCTSAKGLGKPRTAKEIGVLLALMCKYSCEDCKLIAYNETGFKEILHLKKGTILDNMDRVLSEELASSGATSNSSMDLLLNKLQGYTLDRTRIDNLLVVSDIPEGSDGDRKIQRFLDRFRKLVNPELLYVNVSLSDVVSSSSAESNGLDNEKNVYLRGYSEQLLRFLAEKGTEGQMTFVDKIDRIHSLDKGKKITHLATAEDILAVQSRALPHPLASSCLARREIRVFVSSTFRDMYAERDILLRCVFPEIQHRMRQGLGGGFSLCPVDLRWGVTEDRHLHMSSVEQCLREVGRCHLFLGILGERYGFCPTPDHIRAIASKDERYRWLEDYATSGCSVTELEMACFSLRDPEAVRGRVLFYFRNPGFLSSVPVKHRSDLTCETEEARSRMTALKQKIVASGHSVKEYSCKWAGIRDGRPVVKGLKDMAERVSEELWGLIKSVGKTENAGGGESDGWMDFVSRSHAEQWAFVRFEAGKVEGRGTFARSIVSQLNKVGDRILLISGKPASGKTALMTKVARDVKNVIVIPCFRDSWSCEPDPGDVALYLTGILFRIAGLDFELQKVSNSLWKKAVETCSTLGCRLILFLDGWDDGQINWMLETRESNVVYVVSGREGSCVHQAVSSTKPPPRRVEMESLRVEERISVAKAYLSAHGKKLDDRAFSNQMRLLVSKRQADSPVYIQLACEFLRVYADFETVTSELRRMPSTVEPLIREFLNRLENDFGKELVSSMLSILYFCPVELTEEEFYRACCGLRCGGGDSIIPRSTFLLLLHSSSLLFSDSAMKQGLYGIQSGAVRSLLHKMNSSRGMSKVKLSTFQSLLDCSWNAVDPSRRGLLDASDPTVERNIRLLFSVLFELKKQDELFSLLCNMRFVELCLWHGAGARVVEACAQALSGFEGKEPALTGPVDTVILKELRQLLESKLNFLCQYPSLLTQEILNEPEESSLIPLLHDVSVEGDVVFWENKPDGLAPSLKSFRVSDKAVTAVALSSEKTAIVGLADGSVCMLSLETGEEKHSFTGHGQRVSGLCLLDDEGRELCSVSTDGSVCLWDCKALSKIGVLSGHNAAVSSCRRFRWGKVVSLVTTSWDTTIKLWNTQQRKCSEDIKTGSAVNCVDCHPGTSVIVSGHWDGALRLYETAPVRRKGVFRGHKSSVRSAIFTENGAQIVSASMDGQIRVWSSAQGIAVGMFSGHTLPVTGISAFRGNVVTIAEDCVLKVWSETLGVPIRGIEGMTGDSEGVMGVSSVQLNSDSSLVVVGLRHGRLALLDLKNHGSEREIMLFGFLSTNLTDLDTKWKKQFGKLPVVKLRFLRSDKWILVGGTDEAVVVDAYDGSVVFRLEKGGEETLTDADATSDYIAGAYSNGALRVFDVCRGAWKKQTRLEAAATVFGHSGRVTACSLSKDSLHLATVGDDKCLNIWNTGNLVAVKGDPSRVIRNCHTDIISSCVWSPTKNLVVTGSNDCTVKIWSPDSEIPVGVITQHDGPIVSLDVQKSCVVSTSRDGSVCVCSMQGALVTRLKSPKERDSPILPVPTACSLRMNDVRDESMDWARMVEEEQTGAAADEGEQKSLSDGEMNRPVLAVGFGDGSCQLWHPFLGHEKVCAVNHFTPIRCISGEAGSLGVFATGDGSGVCNVWETTEKAGSIIPTHSEAVTLIRRSHEGPWMCSASQDGWVSLWKSPYEAPVFSWMAHGKSVSGAVWVDETSVLTGGEDGSVRLWSIHPSGTPTMTEEKSLGSPISEVWSEKGEDGDGDLVFASTWDAGTFFASKKDLEGGRVAFSETDVSLTEGRGSTEIFLAEKSVRIKGDARGRIAYFHKLVKCHEEAVTGLCVMWEREDEGSFVSVSQDRLLKMWRLNLTTQELHLVSDGLYFVGAWHLQSLHATTQRNITLE